MWLSAGAVVTEGAEEARDAPNPVVRREGAMVAVGAMAGVETGHGAGDRGAARCPRRSGPSQHSTSTKTDR